MKKNEIEKIWRHRIDLLGQKYEFRAVQKSTWFLFCSLKIMLDTFIEGNYIHTHIFSTSHILWTQSSVNRKKPNFFEHLVAIDYILFESKRFSNSAHFFLEYIFCSEYFYSDWKDEAQYSRHFFLILHEQIIHLQNAISSPILKWFYGYLCIKMFRLISFPTNCGRNCPFLKNEFGSYFIKLNFTW